MVACKYFQQGNCRFGQYCRYEHINNFAVNTNRNKNYDGKSVALIVAEDVLAAERGGQWLLSCFGPFKEQPSIPGIEDLSPEEVRWEMYQAKEKGTVDQIKVQFQQLCQVMKAKREVLKNPTPEIVKMLENLQNNAQEPAFITSATPKPSNFSFATPQLGATIPSSTPSVFSGKPFGSSGNPFGGSFGPTGENSLFGGSTATNSGSIFGSKPAFSTNPIFGSPTSTASLFGDPSKLSAPAFGTQITQNFGTLTSQSPVFGGGITTPPVFGQSTAFGTTQAIGSFLRPSSTRTSSVFGSNSTNTFGGQAPSFGNSSIFGSSASTTVFGSTTSENTSIFCQPKTTNAFGTAPLFGGTNQFGSTQPGSIFSGQSTFGSAPVTTNSIFGSSTTSTSMFGSAQNVTAFGSLATNTFGGGTQVTPFGSTKTSFGQTTAMSSPFGQTTTAPATSFGQPTIISTPFGTTNGPFGAASFSQSTPFEQTITSPTFGGTNPSATSLTSGFGVPKSAPPPFGAESNAENVNTTPFATNKMTGSATPFMSIPQVTSASFENARQNQNAFTGTASGPFGKCSFVGFSASTIADDSIFTTEGLLTDDEKSSYLQERFVLGKIPLKAPTKELR